MLDILILLVGFVALIYGANALVDGASALAKQFKVPSIVIGLTIVAFGTSAPELVVNVFASVNGNSEIVLGNILGSNIANILLILGISALFNPLSVKKQTTWIEIPLALLAAVAIYLLADDIHIDHTKTSVISHIDGYILLLFFSIFLAYNISLSIRNNGTEELETKNYSKTKASLFIVFGLTLLILGGKGIVYAATNIAEYFGVSQRIIGLTIIAIGTSLPELVTSIVATRKGQTDIAIGNVVGSNIFNIFFVLGISAIINPISVPASALTDALINISISILLFAFMFIDKSHSISRREGGLMIALYISYILWLILA